jgi:hypothetical protein
MPRRSYTPMLAELRVRGERNVTGGFFIGLSGTGGRAESVPRWPAAAFLSQSL